MSMSKTEVVKDVMSMSGEKYSDNETNVEVLRCEIADLESRLSASLQELEEVKKETKEAIEFYNLIYQIILIELAKSQEKVEYYKRLLGEKVERNSFVLNNRRHRYPDEPVFEVTHDEVLLIALLAIFFSEHQFGAHIDYICSYLLNYISEVEAQDVEDFMRRFSNIFREETTGIGANLKCTWKGMDFKLI